MSLPSSLPPPDGDPIAAFQSWLEEARQRLGDEPAHAMCLATSSADGWPSARMVLLKQVDGDGFAFYTNLQSLKARQIAENPRGSACFFWHALQRQVRVDGVVEPVTDAEADQYFATRPLKSQIGAWASQQSATMEHPGDLLAQVARFAGRYALRQVPRPEFWSGFRIRPLRIEFWAGGEFRLHHRRLFERQELSRAEWTSRLLYP